MFNRRELMSSVAVTVAASALPWPVRADAPPDPKLAALFDAFFQEGLRRNPEGATQLGLDTGANADLEASCATNPRPGSRRQGAQRRISLRGLKAIDAEAPARRQIASTTTRSSIRASRAAARHGVRFRRHGIRPVALRGEPADGRLSVGAGFPRHQTSHRECGGRGRLSVAPRSVRRSARRQHRAHEARRAAWASCRRISCSIPRSQQLSATLHACRSDRSSSRRSPSARRRRGSMRQLRDESGRASTPTRSRRRSTRQIDQAKACARTPSRCGDVAIQTGRGHFTPVALHSTTTTTNKSPEEVHQFGLDQAQRNHRAPRWAAEGARPDARDGRRAHRRRSTQGSEKSLSQHRCRQGRCHRLSATRGCTTIRPKLPTVFKRLPNYSFEVRRVPPATEPGAASAFSQAPALDGSRPGIVYFNLHDSRRMAALCAVDHRVPRRPAGPSARRRACALQQEPAAHPQDRSASRAMPKAGRFMPSNWPTRSACMTTTRWAASAI